MAKSEKSFANPVFTAELAEGLKIKVAVVAKRRPKMGEERRARIASLKGRKVENVPGQDVNDFFALTEDIDSREELVVYYNANIGKHGATVDAHLKAEVTNHKAEQEADKDELEALFGDYGGRDVVLEAVMRRTELRGNIRKFTENLKKNSAKDAMPDEIAMLVKRAIELGIVEEGPGPIVWGGKPYIARVDDDETVSEFVKVFSTFINNWKTEADRIRAARKEKAAEYVMSRDDLASKVKASINLREFLNCAEEAQCVLPVNGHDNRQGGVVFFAGEALLEKNGNEIVCRKVSTDHLARMLFFYTDREGKHKQHDEVTVKVTKYDFSEVRSGLLRDALEAELKLCRATDAKIEAERKARRELFEKACSEFGATVLSTENIGKLFDLENGLDGKYAIRGVFGRNESPIAYIVERVGQTVKVRWSLPGDATKLLFGAGGKVLDMNNLPLSTREKPVTMRTLLRVLFLQYSEAEVPGYMAPVLQNVVESHEFPMEEEQPAASEG